jgi:hypothetical protein
MDRLNFLLPAPNLLLAGAILRTMLLEGMVYG